MSPFFILKLSALLIELMRNHVIFHLIYLHQDSANCAFHGSWAFMRLLNYWMRRVPQLRIQVRLLQNRVRRIPQQRRRNSWKVIRHRNFFILFQFFFNRLLRQNLVTNLHMLLQNEDREILVALRAFVLPRLALILKMILIIIKKHIILALLTLDNNIAVQVRALLILKPSYSLLRLLKSFLSR